jgi:hypothetical protein
MSRSIDERTRVAYLILANSVDNVGDKLKKFRVGPGVPDRPRRPGAPALRDPLDQTFPGTRSPSSPSPPETAPRAGSG